MLRSTAEIIKVKQHEMRPIPVIWAAGGFLIGLLAAALWSLETMLPAYEPDAASGAQVQAGSAFPKTTLLTVDSQASGSSVRVAHASVPGTWAAVVELRGETLGNILGAARILPSEGEIDIPLLRATLPGSIYAVVLYRDDGDGEFSPTGDSVYIDTSTGTRVVVPFSTFK